MREVRIERDGDVVVHLPNGEAVCRLAFTLPLSDESARRIGALVGLAIEVELEEDDDAKH